MSAKSRKKKIAIPGIGLRIIKSAIAVAICYIINLLRKDQGMVFLFSVSSIVVYSNVSFYIQQFC